MPLDKPLSPQGYNIGVDPTNTNPFFDGAPGGGGGGEGVTEYNKLTGRPFINGKVLEGNKDLLLATPAELEALNTELMAEITKTDGIVAEEQAGRIEADKQINQRIDNIQLTPGPAGKDGAPGAPGRDGVDGSAATIHVGTVTTGNPGTEASVVNAGTENAAILNFTIPRGSQGLQGIPGNDGAPGIQGPAGDAGRIEHVSAETVPYTEPASVENTGTPENAILHFKIPQGVPGTGGGGEGGSTISVNVGSTVTGEPGSNAEVTNSGTEENVILNFKIPRGNTGETGPAGKDGINGKDFTYEDFTPEQLEALRGPQGIQGVPGSDGAPGVDGKAATIQVGTTETLAPGTDASVENTGTENAAILTFKIPRGNTGETGPAGKDGINGKDFTYEDFTPEQLEALRGPQGIQGVPGVDGKAATIQVGTTETLAPGTDATVENTGTENATILTFKIPRGNTGETGPAGKDGINGKDFTYEDFTPEQLEALRGPRGIQGVPGSDGTNGVDGKAATIRVGTTTTLPPGSRASVTNVGTANAAILNFAIPQGATGQQGEPGSGGGGTSFGFKYYNAGSIDFSTSGTVPYPEDIENNQIVFAVIAFTSIDAAIANKLGYMVVVGFSGRNGAAVYPFVTPGDLTLQMTGSGLYHRTLNNRSIYGTVSWYYGTSNAGVATLELQDDPAEVM